MGCRGGPGSRHSVLPVAFPGQYFDAETGLHYDYLRYYDPLTARFVLPDPLGLEPAPNHEAYVSNPFLWFDPLGLAPYRVKPGKQAPHELHMSPHEMKFANDLHAQKPNLEIYRTG